MMNLIMSSAEASERNKAWELQSGFLKEAKGDTNTAFILLSAKTADLIDVANETQLDLEFTTRSLKRCEEYNGLTEKSFFSRVWDSDGMKVIIFIGGVWLGSSMVHSVN